MWEGKQSEGNLFFFPLLAVSVETPLHIQYQNEGRVLIRAENGGLELLWVLALFFLFFFFFLTNCWSSVVASVVLPQLGQSPLSFFPFFSFSSVFSMVDELCPQFFSQKKISRD